MLLFLLCLILNSYLNFGFLVCLVFVIYPIIIFLFFLFLFFDIHFYIFAFDFKILAHLLLALYWELLKLAERYFIFNGASFAFLFLFLSNYFPLLFIFIRIFVFLFSFYFDIHFNYLCILVNLLTYFALFLSLWLG